MAAQRSMAAFVLAIAAALSLVFPPRSARAQNFTLRYIVSLENSREPVVSVRWELAGIDEVQEISLRFRGPSPRELKATGILLQEGERWIWRPTQPYARLFYRVDVNSRRGSQQRFDSYLASNWLVSHARQLFPLVGVTYRAPYGAPAAYSKLRSRATLAFQMPPGWRCVAPYAARQQNVFELSGRRSFLTPRGWFACGHLESEAREIAGVRIELAQVGGVAGDREEIFTFLEATFPLLHRLLAGDTARILIIRAPDPMWHGGISGEGSLFLHAKRPVRDPDRTSAYLHELFHVLQPFKPAADADWLVEGLAEFYSLELQRRAGLLDERGFKKGLRLFERYGLWNVDLRRQHDNPATNNSAPLVLYALDQRIQRLTAGKARLDDVLRRLAESQSRVDSATFQSTAESVAGASLKRFFERYVFAGQVPQLNRVD
ncbi:MAG: hypothetical protein N3C12_04270 [Candidatus Binatia bacterium]|nr:hypothetical protein [Candidatus Binatia bacterium]